MIKSGFSVKFKKQFFLSSLAESKVTVIFLIYRVWLSFDIEKKHFYFSVRELTVSKLDQLSKQPMANPSKMPNLQLFRGLLKN